MFNKINFVIFFFYIFSVITSSQEKITEYKEPAILEGSNLSVYALPFFSYTNYESDESGSRFNYHLRLSSDYLKWRFTDRLEYTVSAGINSVFEGNPYNSSGGSFSFGVVEFRGGTSYYLTKNKFYAGIYNKFRADFRRKSKPMIQERVFPYLGYGKLSDAFVINETSNLEKILIDENFIDKPLNQRIRILLNSILDKRNGNVFSSLYKNDAEIEFFTELEKVLIDEKVINKPLNARTTMKLYQSLYDPNFILFPLYKGYLFQAEFEFPFIYYDETFKAAKTLTLSTAFGIPLDPKTSVLFSAHFAFPLNNNFNIFYDEANMHGPLFMKSEFQNISNYSYLFPDHISINGDYFDYKTTARINIFHYLSNTAGMVGSLEYVNGKSKTDNHIINKLNATAGLIFNILNKLRLDTGVNFYFTNSKDHEFYLFSDISYYIF